VSVVAVAEYKLANVSARERAQWITSTKRRCSVGMPARTSCLKLLPEESGFPSFLRRARYSAHLICFSCSRTASRCEVRISSSANSSRNSKPYLSRLAIPLQRIECQQRPREFLGSDVECVRHTGTLLPCTREYRHQSRRERETEHEWLLAARVERSRVRRLRQVQESRLRRHYHHVVAMMVRGGARQLQLIGCSRNQKHSTVTSSQRRLMVAARKGNERRSFRAGPAMTRDSEERSATSKCRDTWRERARSRREMTSSHHRLGSVGDTERGNR